MFKIFLLKNILTLFYFRNYEICIQVEIISKRIKIQRGLPITLSCSRHKIPAFFKRIVEYLDVYVVRTAQTIDDARIKRY